MVPTSGVLAFLLVGALLSGLGTAHAAQGNSGYVGVLGAGAAMHSPLVEHFEWGMKAEGGYLFTFGGASVLGVVRYTVPREHGIPLFVEGGVGALLAFGGVSGVKPWGSLTLGAKLDGWTLIFQPVGFPIIGVVFPI